MLVAISNGQGHASRRFDVAARLADVRVKGAAGLDRNEVTLVDVLEAFAVGRLKEREFLVPGGYQPSHQPSRRRRPYRREIPCRKV